MEPWTIARNADELRRLEALVASLTDEALAAPVHEGWTVAVSLAHLAFWERFDLQVLTRWR